MELKNGECLKLPDSIREELSKPFGDVLSEDELIRRLSSKNYILMSVGDEVSKTLVRNDIAPKIAVFDLKTRRQELTDNILVEHYKKREVVASPQAQITFDLWRSISEAIKSHANTAIQVIGEEDLAALVCAYLAPNGWALLFGIPLKGIDITVIDDSVRSTAERILNKMELVKTK